MTQTPPPTTRNHPPPPPPLPSSAVDSRVGLFCALLLLGRQVGALIVYELWQVIEPTQSGALLRVQSLIRTHERRPRDALSFAGSVFRSANSARSTRSWRRVS